MADEKILLVDDEEDFTETLAERLESRGVKVVVVSTGPDAIKKVAAESFDAVVLDMVLPGMDGIETLKRMLEINPALQVILLTGHATFRKGIEAIRTGAVDFLEKPAGIETLMKKIEDASARKKLLLEKPDVAKVTEILKKLKDL